MIKWLRKQIHLPSLFMLIQFASIAQAGNLCFSAHVATIFEPSIRDMLRLRFDDITIDQLPRPASTNHALAILISLREQEYLTEGRYQRLNPYRANLLYRSFMKIPPDPEAQPDVNQKNLLMTMFSEEALENLRADDVFPDLLKQQPLTIYDALILTSDQVNQRDDHLTQQQLISIFSAKGAGCLKKISPFHGKE